MTWAAFGLALLLAFAAIRLLSQPGPGYERAEASLHAHDAQAVTSRLARSAIHDNPLDGRAYRVLAASVDRQGKKDEAAVLYGIAAARGPRDLPSQAWLVRRELERSEYPAALSRIDQMLRVKPGSAGQLYPVLLELASEKSTAPAVAALLEKKPLWRNSFIQTLIAQVPAHPSLFLLMERLRRGPSGLEPAELAWWIDGLVQAHRWGAAYLTWVDSLDASAKRHIGNVFNGSFEQEPTLNGFDWRFSQIAGARIERTQVTGADGELALQVSFEDRRVPFQNVSQLLALAPGTYRFSGHSRLDQLRSDRGLVWSLTCAEDQRLIGETDPFAGNHGWRPFEKLIVIPTENCGGQWLTLRLPARIPAEQRIGGVAWFDGLRMDQTALP